jgi:hypothetical protein
MFLQMALHSCMCQIYPLTHTPLLKMMVYFFNLQSVMRFVTKPPIDYVGEMTNMMEITQLDFFLEYKYLPLVLLWCV